MRSAFGYFIFSVTIWPFQVYSLCWRKNPAEREAVYTENALLGTGESVQNIFNKYADMVYRMARLYMKNHQDSEDIVQDVFVILIREIKSGKIFESGEHEKAWLIVTTGNLCKNRLREKRRTELPLEDYDHLPVMDRNRFYLYEAILALPDNYKCAVYLFYYEGYRTEEIAAILHERPTTIRAWLSRARKQLKKDLGGEILD